MKSMLHMPIDVKSLKKYTMVKNIEQIKTFSLLSKSYHSALSLGIYISFQPPNQKIKNNVIDSLEP